MQQYQDLLVDALLDQGFTVTEAEMLVNLQLRVDHAIHMAHQQQEGQQWLFTNFKTDHLKNI